MKTGTILLTLTMLMSMSYAQASAYKDGRIDLKTSSDIVERKWDSRPQDWLLQNQPVEIPRPKNWVWYNEPVAAPKPGWDRNLYPIDPIERSGGRYVTRPTVLTLAEMQQNVLNNFANYIRNNAYSRSIDQETLFAILQNIFTNPKLKLSNSTIEATTYLTGEIYYLFKNGLTSPDKMQTFLKDLSDQMSAILEQQARQLHGPQGGVRHTEDPNRDRNQNRSPIDLVPTPV